MPADPAEHITDQGPIPATRSQDAQDTGFVERVVFSPVRVKLADIAVERDLRVVLLPQLQSFSRDIAEGLPLESQLRRCARRATWAWGRSMTALCLR